ncbi:MAG: response regulator transcription factor [Kiritimatiellae bacterium]|nr:response regulator transcription factor [Kiritimatiellia bacterium]
MTKVFIVDDHAVVRMGLKATLPLEGDVEIVGEAVSGDGAAQAVITARSDVTLLDIRLPGKDGLEVLDELMNANPDAKVIMLTTSEADNHVYEALKRGARGYVVKDRDADEILTAVRMVANGAKYIPDTVRALYRERQMMPDLTAREQETLEMMAAGRRNGEIAKKFGISVDGVKMHVKHILEKFNVADRTAAVAEALRRGFIRQ